MTNDWELTIKKIHNGYVIKGLGDVGDGPTQFEECFEDKTDQHIDCEESELVSTFQMLLAVIEYFGMQGSKHDKYRLKVSIQKKED